MTTTILLAISTSLIVAVIFLMFVNSALRKQIFLLNSLLYNYRNRYSEASNDPTP